MLSLLLLLLGAQAREAPLDESPDRVVVDLLRAEPGGPRIYVQAAYPDGSTGIFLVDTGADVTLIREEVARRLGLGVRPDRGALIGLGGVTRMDLATLPSLRIGEAVIRDLEVAVGAPGLPRRAGAMLLDGLLGNDVWSRFTLELDYPSDTMVLHRPGAVERPASATPLLFDGHHLFTPVEIRTRHDRKTVHNVVLRLDTGAGGLALCGTVAEAFDVRWTEGVEPVLGLGGSSRRPYHQLHRRTRHLELASVRLAGKKLKKIRSARWIGFESSKGCPDGLRGLVGHELLAAHRVLIDYQNGWLHLGRSRRPRRRLDGHAVLLERELAGDAPPERALYRATLALELDDERLAREELELAIEVDTTRAEALILLARLERDPADALARLLLLDPSELVDHGAILLAVDAMFLLGQHEGAEDLAREATAARPDAAASWVALSDALLARERFDEANEALSRAIALEHTDAYRLRQARLALAAGDRLGAMAQLRRMLHLYPMSGSTLWFYGQLVQTEDERETFLIDIETARAKLHPDEQPLDHLAAAYRLADREPDALRAWKAGRRRDCRPLQDHAKANCLAWYDALVHVHPGRALRRIRRALHEAGPRADYLDTLAAVHRARGEEDDSLEALHRALALEPDALYLLWQLTLHDYSTIRRATCMIGRKLEWVTARQASSGLNHRTSPMPSAARGRK